MLTLHHLEQSRSQRIVWLLEELGVEYEIKSYPRVNQLAPPELKQIHPRGKSPVITDGDLTIAESGVIVEYLIEKYGNGRFITPTGDKQKQLDDRYFQHFAEGSMMPYLVMKLLFMDSAFIGPNIKSCMQLVSDTLTKDGGRQWLAGGSEPTGADFMMSFPLEAAYYGGRADDLPQPIKQYVERVQARPAYQRGLQKTPGYKYVPNAAKL